METLKGMTSNDDRSGCSREHSEVGNLWICALGSKYRQDPCEGVYWCIYILRMSKYRFMEYRVRLQICTYMYTNVSLKIKKSITMLNSSQPPS